MKTSLLAMIAIILTTPFAFAQDVIVLDDGPSTGLGPGVSIVSGTWDHRTEAQHGGTWEQTGSRFSQNHDAHIRYATTLPTTGIWALEIWTTNTLNRNDPTATITHGDGTSSSSFNVNQADLANARNQWLSLGHYDFTSTSATYEYNLQLSSNTGTGVNSQNTDAVRWVRLDANPAEATPVVVGVAGGISQDFYQESGTWSTSTNRKGVYEVFNRLSEELGATATFSAPLQAYQYEVKFTWNIADDRSQDTLVQVFDAHGVTHQFRVDQTVAPAGDVFHGVNWMSLGAFDLNASSTVRVIADETALSSGRFVVADGVQFIAIPEPGTLVLVGIALGSLLIFRRRR
jgi:hypothetical protein